MPQGRVARYLVLDGQGWLSPRIEVKLVQSILGMAWWILQTNMTAYHHLEPELFEREARRESWLVDLVQLGEEEIPRYLELELL